MSVKRSARLCILAMIAMAVSACATTPAQELGANWRPLFNGRNLDGWTPKITTYVAGQDPLNTFRVRDGVIAVDYSAYGDNFSGRFGHLFYKTPYKAYRLRLKYKLIGDKLFPGAPNYAFANSGVMIFSQSAESVPAAQNFPASVEAQILGVSAATPVRFTGNVCTPATNIYMNGAMVPQHCTNSSQPVLPNDTWVDMEVDVSPEGKVTQYINGKLALSYERVELDPRDATATPLIQAAGGSLTLTGGYIALQSEGHPIEFKNVEIKAF